MAMSKINFLAFLVVALVATSCMRLENGSTAYPTNNNSSYGSVPSRQVIQSDLPAPDGEQSALSGNYSPPSGEAPIGADGNSIMAEVNPNAVAIGPEAISGVWRASIEGMTCQIATPQSKFGNVYRAGPLHCPEALGGIRSWAIVNNNQLAFYDGNGQTVATLYSSGSGYSGQTREGSAISLSR